MSIRETTITVAVAGSAGAAVGSAVSGAPIHGKIIAFYVDYVTQPATADVTITAGTPAATLLTLTNANTDGWFYPRVLLQSTVGANLSAVYDQLAVNGYVTVAVAQGNAGSVVVTAQYEDD